MLLRTLFVGDGVGEGLGEGEGLGLGEGLGEGEGLGLGEGVGAGFVMYQMPTAAMMTTTTMANACT